VTFFHDDIGMGIQTSLIQIYPILLSTLLSIGHQTLSLYDATFALLLTSSPLTIYLVFASIRHLFRFETSLYQQIESHRCIISFFGALVLVLWFVLSVLLRFVDQAFVDSDLCRGSRFKNWVADILWYLVVLINAPFEFGYLGFATFIILLLVFMLCLFRRRSQAKERFRADMEGKSGLWRVLWTPWTFMNCAWCVSAVAVPS
jgi:hypothetical protein